MSYSMCVVVSLGLYALFMFVSDLGRSFPPPFPAPKLCLISPYDTIAGTAECGSQCPPHLGAMVPVHVRQQWKCNYW